MLPYAIRHPGVSVDELARKFGVTTRDVVEDLNLVFLCGLPGYGPGDLIDVAIDEDKIYVRMADYFGSPLRLTSAEALTLYAGAAALAQLPHWENASSLQSALAKLGRALGLPEDEAGIDVKVEESPAAHLEAIEEALSRRKRIELEYHSASRGAMTTREVQPWGLLIALGRWYLVGHDGLSGEERMFRLDRVKRVTITNEPAEVPDDFDPDRYRGAFVPGEKDREVTIEISPAAARWFEDYYPVVSARELPDGWREVKLLASGERWTATLLLRLGEDVRNVRPESMGAAAGDLAASIAAAYAA